MTGIVGTSGLQARVAAAARAAPAWMRQRAMRRAAVPAEWRTWRPAIVWFAVAAGLAGGGALPGPLSGAGGVRVAVPAALVVLAATRPGRGGVVWLLAAVAVVGGGVRADAIDRAAGARVPSSLDRARVTLTAPLPASSPDHASTARGRFGDRDVVVSAPRFGARSGAMPRGAAITVGGRVEPLGTDGNDARLRRQGVGARILADSITWDGARRGGVAGAIDRFAGNAAKALSDAVGGRRGALLAGMALGSADAISDADRDALRTSGLWHLVSASGGNIALVVALVMALGWMVGLSDRWRLAAAALAICAYVPLAGSGPSIERAGVMGLAGLASLWVGREHRGADALAMAAALTLALNPYDVLDVGWQLSFAASAVLMLAGPRTARRLGEWGLPTWLAIGLACTIVATIATAPITLLVFGQLSLIGLVANALALPLVGIAVWSGALAAVFTPLSPLVAGWLAQPGGVSAGLMLQIADWSSSRSLAVVGVAGAAAVGLGCALVWVVRPPRLAVAGLAALAVGWLVLSVPRPPGEPRLVVLDIGQGSAALLQDGPRGVLVDTGPENGGVVGELRKAGIRQLTAVVMSHPAADHDGGAAAVLAAFPTDLLLDGGEPGGGPTHDAAVRVAVRRGVRVEPVRAGQTLTAGRIIMRIRWPTPAATRLPGDPNDRAAVVDATVGSLHALLPADAEGNVLRKLGGLSDAVLVVSHHGSTDPDLPAVLAHLRPQLAVISVGARNTYGHPTAPTLAALGAAHVPTLRTDRDGSIDVRGDPTGRVVVRRIAPGES